jgi:SAM-dependent methyltransferase
MYAGPVEAIPEQEGPFDVIASFDVIEHLKDPVATISRCVRMLAGDGLLVVQMPFFVPEEPYEKLKERGHPTLRLLVPDEHLFLYSREAARRLMERCGAPYVEWEPAIFGHYDQFFFASKRPFRALPANEADEAYLAAGGGRIALALVDALRAREEAAGVILRIEEDRVRQQELLQRFEKETAWGFAARWLARLKQRLAARRARQ